MQINKEINNLIHSLRKVFKLNCTAKTKLCVQQKYFPINIESNYRN